jgi:hypothetical protein
MPLLSEFPSAAAVAGVVVVTLGMVLAMRPLASQPLKDETNG